MSYVYTNARLDIARPRTPSPRKLKRLLRQPVTTAPQATDADHASSVERLRFLTLSRRYDK